MRSLPLLLALLMGASLFCEGAEAEPLRGAQSVEVQRPAPSSKIVAAEVPQPAPAASRWLAPVAAFAAGLGLGWLATQGGLASLLVAALIGVLAGTVVFVLLRTFAARRPELSYALEEPIAATPPTLDPPVQRRAESPSPPPAAPQAPRPEKRREAAPAAPAPERAPSIPSDFDSASFIRQAKLNFIRLQDANDRGDLATLREVTTERMFDAILAQLEPNRSAQRTDVVSLNASLLELATRGDLHAARVRFQGMVREGNREAAPFEEVWHLQKPVSGTSGWVLAGIQQVS